MGFGTRGRTLLVEALKAATVTVIAFQVAATGVFCIYGAQGIVRWNSWRPLALFALFYATGLAVLQLVRRRESAAKRVVQSAIALGVLAGACHVVACSKGLYPKRLPPPLPANEAAATAGLDLVAAARSQIGVTVKYDPSYQKIAYPGGDVPRERGVCSDVVIRALRDARGIDLQKLVHEDMSAHFTSYPSLTRWRMFAPDSNIDHRRVLNLERFFERRGWSLGVTRDARAYLPGDLVTCLIDGDLPHIMIVSDRKTAGGVPLVIHNVGSGVCEEDRLFRYQTTGHHRLPPSGGQDAAGK